MGIEQRILTCRLLEKMNVQKKHSSKLGLENVSAKVLSGKRRGDYDILFIIDVFCDVIRIDVFSGNWIPINGRITGSCFLDRN